MRRRAKAKADEARQARGKASVKELQRINALNLDAGGDHEPSCTGRVVKLEGLSPNGNSQSPLTGTAQGVNVEENAKNAVKDK